MEFDILLVYILTYFGLFISIFFLLTLFENKNEKRKALPKELPKVSIIVPAYNEENNLNRTINSLLELDYPKEKLEIIIVNDGSTDNTLKIAKSFIPYGVKIYTKKNGGKGKALNYGLKRVTGTLVGCLDADSFVEKESLKKIIPYFYDKNIMAVTPALKVDKPKNFFQRIQMIEYFIGIFLRKIFSYLNSIHVTPGPFTIYRKEFFDRYGGYAEHNLTEDIEIALRIQKNGYRIENSTNAVVYTNVPLTFKDLLKQRLRWYTGFIENVSDYKELFSIKHGNLGIFILPAAFISILLVIISMFYFGYRFFSDLIQNYINLKSIDFDFLRLVDFDISRIYINLNAAMILSLLTFFSGLIILFITKRMIKERTKLSFSYVLYIFFYWFLFGFWWFLAIIYKVLKRKVAW